MRICQTLSDIFCNLFLFRRITTDWLDYSAWLTTSPVILSFVHKHKLKLVFCRLCNKKFNKKINYNCHGCSVKSAREIKHEIRSTWRVSNYQIQEYDYHLLDSCEPTQLCHRSYSLLLAAQLWNLRAADCQVFYWIVCCSLMSDDTIPGTLSTGSRQYIERQTP